jgi:hypothetical protein
MNQEKEEIKLKFENEYDFDETIEEIYYIFHDCYDKSLSIEEAKQMLLQFLEG